MPLSSTALMAGMPGPSNSSDALKSSINGGNEKSIITPKLEDLPNRCTLRRPPLPPNYFQTKPLSKIAVIKPNSFTRIISRSPSPSLSTCRSPSASTRSFHGSNSSMTRSLSRCSSLGSAESDFLKSSTPRRIFPQESPASGLDLEELSNKEQAPVVFGASLNFVLGIQKQKVRQSFRPTASHLENETASNILSSKISQFLQRTDHIMDEWKRIGNRNESSEMTDYRNKDLLKTRSATNIMIKGFQYYSRSNSVARSPSRSASRLSENTFSECNGEVRIVFLRFKINSNIAYV